jgi:hypothetical protein
MEDAFSANLFCASLENLRNRVSSPEAILKRSNCRWSIGISFSVRRDMPELSERPFVAID